MYRPKPTRAVAWPSSPSAYVNRDGVEYTIIGTAHVSRASADAVADLAGEGDFDAIAVELCQARYDALTAERKWTDLDLYKIIRERKAGLVMANLALSAYQRRIAEQFGIEPGAEMRAAAGGSQRTRPAAATGRSRPRHHPATQLCQRSLVQADVPDGRHGLGMVSSEEIDEEEIEKLKEGDILESTFTEFAEQSPELFEALIAERDRYMAARLRRKILQIRQARSLLVIGAGHMEGLSGYLESSSEDRLNERTSWSKCHNAHAGRASFPGPSWR